MVIFLILLIIYIFLKTCINKFYINYFTNFFSIFSFEPFDGGEKNLLLALQQKPETSENVLLEKLFSIFDSWYTGKDNAQELDTVN